MDTNNLTPECGRLVIKEEDSLNEENTINNTNEENNVQIKHETEDITEENPFENIQIEIKHELPTNDKEPNAMENDAEIKIELTEVLRKEITVINVKNETPESILPNNEGEINIKERDTAVKVELENVVDYDYPNFDDSMDSSEAAALSHVEACLSDDVQVKAENYVSQNL